MKVKAVAKAKKREGGARAPSHGETGEWSRKDEVDLRQLTMTARKRGRGAAIEGRFSTPRAEGGDRSHSCRVGPMWSMAAVAAPEPLQLAAGGSADAHLRFAGRERLGFV